MGSRGEGETGCCPARLDACRGRAGEFNATERGMGNGELGIGASQPGGGGPGALLRTFAWPQFQYVAPHGDPTFCALPQPPAGPMRGPVPPPSAFHVRSCCVPSDRVAGGQWRLRRSLCGQPGWMLLWGLPAHSKFHHCIHLIHVTALRLFRRTKRRQLCSGGYSAPLIHHVSNVHLGRLLDWRDGRAL